MSKRTSEDGFTLIELLVVIAIIIALLAILLPSMNRAFEIANRAVCASNQHQITIAMVEYATDRLGQLPQGGESSSDQSIGPHILYEGTWRILSDDYGLVPMVMHCPSAYVYSTIGLLPALDVISIGGNASGTSPTEEDLYWAPKTHNAGWTTDGRRMFSFAMVSMLKDMGSCTQPSNTVYESAARMTDPSSKHMLADRIAMLAQDSTAPYRIGGVSHFTYVKGTPFPEGANRSYLDLSVAWIDPDNLGANDTALTPHPTNPLDWAGTFRYKRSSCSHVKERYFW